jgi:hypothetical protein
MRGKWIAVALVVLGVSAAFAGLLGFQKSVDPVAAAATKSQDAGGAKVALTVGVDSSQGSFSVSANGVVGKGQADITANLSQAGGGSIELRYLQESGDPVVYVNAPMLTTFIPGGKPWVRLDLEQAAKSAGVDLNQVLSQAAQNPADVLALLQSVGSVQTVGTETIDGVQTTHYKATVDLAKAADQVGEPAKTMVQHLIEQGGPSSIPVDVWIGDDGLVRKATVDETVSSPGGDSATVHLTLGLSDYGTVANVTAPPSSDTLDVTGLLSQLGQSLPHS